MDARARSHGPLIVVSAAGIALLAWLIWLSRHWPLISDAALFHYKAWLITEGAAPYRDAFDMNFPGIYFVHLAVLSVGGPGDLAWRALDLGWLGVTVLLIYAYARPLADHVGAAAAGLLFAIYHLADGAFVAGQRDYLLGLFLLAGALGVARWWETAGRAAPLVAGGLALGAGMVIKPHAGLYWLVCAAAAALVAPRIGRRSPAAAAMVIAAGLTAPAAVVGWLAWTGGLGAFLSTFIGWTVPIYRRLHSDRSPLHPLISLKWALFAILAVTGAVASQPPRLGPRRWLALAGAGYGLLHITVQSKSWPHYFSPLAVFLCVLAAPALAVASREGRSRLADARRAAALGLFAAVMLILGVRALTVEVGDPRIADRESRVTAMTRDLRPLVRPGDTVQVIGLPAVHALLRLGLHMPTRFLEESPLFFMEGDPRTQAMRAEFSAALEAAPPAAIVATTSREFGDGYERLARFPAVASLLERRYRLAVEGDRYRIYVRR
ncbi:MAG TPA: glycosyltransferase family 39 protein [Methylomirabilota bacterium]|nr:glycosyltransferase family 39 protein [Methylomirabilota bacterium]